MKTIDHFLQERVSASTPGKINAPEFIYQIIYGELPSGGLRGRGAEHPEKIVNGVGIDKAIPKKAIRQIDKISKIETRSSCQGESEIRPTFLIIRIPGATENQVKKFVDNMSSFQDIYCGYDIGNEGQIRIGIATLLWPEKDMKSFKRWWLELPEKIQRSLKI